MEIEWKYENEVESERIRVFSEGIVVCGQLFVHTRRNTNTSVEGRQFHEVHMV